MFKNREIRTRIVKVNPKTTADGELEATSIDPEHINELAKDFVTHNGETATEFVTTAGEIAKDMMKTAAKLAVGVMAVSFVLTVASEVIVKNLNQD
jgi:hypothetical protein